MEGDDGTGKTNQNPDYRGELPRQEINFDDFFDSTPEKDEPAIEIL